jgi:hypothetical protein
MLNVRLGSDNGQMFGSEYERECDLILAYLQEEDIVFIRFPLQLPRTTSLTELERSISCHYLFLPLLLFRFLSLLSTTPAYLLFAHVSLTQNGKRSNAGIA